MTDAPSPRAPMSSAVNLPYLTAEFAGIGGQIKQRPDDFVVTEIPLYEPSDEGSHTFFAIEKVGIDTRTAVVRIANALGRPARDFGYAGMKDKQAVARQIVSIEHVEPQRILALDVPEVRVLWARRHNNKLRLGHLRGNRFDLKIRGVAPTAIGQARQILDVLVRRGLPNYFGPQRFGVRHTGHLLGLALLRGHDQEFLDLLLGRPDERIDYGPLLRARQLYERGQFEDARLAWPGHHRDERAALAALARGKPIKRARYAIDKHLRRFFMSALQSFLFNEVLVARLQTIDTLLVGDLAYRHGHGAVFLVEDLAAEQVRADRMEVSPSGPLYGFKMTWPQGQPEQIERDVVARHGVDVQWFGQGEHRIRGDRRPLRIPLVEPQLDSGDDDAGTFVRTAFTLPSGAYATVVLRELMKNDVAQADQGDQPAEE